ncbi:MAG: hypothetical protein R6V34_01155 [Bacteroidales bacterium]
MKVLLKRLGIFVVLAGVGVLAYSEFQKLENNTLLIWSGGLVVVGLLLYILVNSLMQE